MMIGRKHGKRRELHVTLSEDAALKAEALMRYEHLPFSYVMERAIHDKYNKLPGHIKERIYQKKGG